MDRVNLVKEAKRMKCSRVFLVVSRTLNPRTGEIDKVRMTSATASTACPAHLAQVMAIGGGSVVDTAKIMQRYMRRRPLTSGYRFPV